MIGAIAAGVGALGSIAGSVMGNNAQQDAMKDAAELQYLQMQQANKLFRPYRQAGTDALGQYQDNIGNQPTYQNTLANLVNDPGFQFRLQQGQNTLENSAAARGNLLSGATLKDLQGYAQGMASQEGQAAYTRDMNAYNNTQNQLANLMQQGYGATGQTVGMGQASTNNLANLAMQGGQAQANMYTQLGNIANNAAGNYFMYDYLGGGGAAPQGQPIAMNGNGQQYANYA